MLDLHVQGVHIERMKLADYIDAANLNYRKFAELVGIDTSSVNRLRRGETRPDWETVARIAAATKGAVTANDFMPEPAPEQTGAAA
jgi:transcriptional regulator with XRE-family HTH domain